MKVVAILLCSVILTFSQDNSTAQGETAQANQTVPVTNETQTSSNATDESQPEQKESQDYTCPTWKCSKLYHREADYCIYKQNKTSQAIVNSNYNNSINGCYISDLFNLTKLHLNGKREKIYAVADLKEDANLTSNSTKDYMESHLCEEQDVKVLRAQLQCRAYCKFVKQQENVTLASGLVYLKQTTSKNCNYASYKKDQLKKNKGNGTLKDLNQCNLNSQCASANCQCVPVTDKSEYRGRCGIGVNHEFFEKLWSSVCEETVLLDDICQQIILVNQSPLLVQLAENEKNNQLECFQRFNDYQHLPSVNLAEQKKGISVALIVILVLVGAVIFGVVIYCCCCRKRDGDYKAMDN